MDGAKLELTEENVQATVRACLFDAVPEDPSKARLVEGVVSRFGFDPERLKEREADIVALLEQLPRTFRKSEGGGYSFLGGSVREDGSEWAGSQRTVDELFCLGTAIDKVKLCLPRDLWSSLPGGMPYYVVEL